MILIKSNKILIWRKLKYLLRKTFCDGRDKKNVTDVTLSCILQYIPYFSNNWDKIWYIDKLYIHKFYQLSKLTFGDLWWPLVTLSDFSTNWFEIWYFGLYYLYIPDQINKLTFGDLWWPLVNFQQIDVKFDMQVYHMWLIPFITDGTNW